MSSYTDIVGAMAKDQPPSPVEVESIIDEVGKTLEELRGDVDKHRRRLQLKAQVASLLDIARELAEIDRQIKEEDKQLELAESRHDELTTPPYIRKKELREKRLEAPSASQKLFIHFRSSTSMRFCVLQATEHREQAGYLTRN